MESEETSLDGLLEIALAVSGAQSPNDALVVALHSSLLSSGFVCTCVGDKTFGDGVKLDTLSSPETPMLPGGWNRSQEVWILQYRHQATQQMCLMKAITMGEALLISAVMASQMNKVVSMSVTSSKYVKESRSYTSPKIYKNLLELVLVLQNDVVGKLKQICEESASRGAGAGAGQFSQSSPPRRRESSPAGLDPPHLMTPPRGLDPRDIRDPLRIGSPREPGGRQPIGDPDPLGDLGPFGYGDRDRLPFGGTGGGGMIFDPLRPGSSGSGSRGSYSGFPPGHPPGARYDPVGPLRPSFQPQFPRGRPRPPGPFHGPSPDHLPPPGYDDMFS